MTLESALITAVVTQFTAIGAMAGWFKSQFSRLASKLDECEEDRQELWETLAENGIRKPVHPTRHPRRRSLREPQEGED